MAKLAAAFGPALGGVFLITNPWLGLLLWLAIAQTPRLAGFAVLGLAIALGGQRLLGIEEIRVYRAACDRTLSWRGSLPAG